MGLTKQEVGQQLQQVFPKIIKNKEKIGILNKYKIHDGD